MAKGWLRLGVAAGALVFLGSSEGQATQGAPVEKVETKTPLAFEVVSVKPAPPGAVWIVPPFMRDKGVRILGVQKMVAPVNQLIGYAYGMQMSEALAAFRKQPEWTKEKVYTVTFGAEAELSRDQVREMMRTMLADRFSLQIHDFMMEGTVDKFVLNKPGVLGPSLKPHPADASCTRQDGSAVG